MFGPSSVNQSNVGVTVVVAALERAKNTDLRVGGHAVEDPSDAGPRRLSVEYDPASVRPVGVDPQVEVLRERRLEVRRVILVALRALAADLLDELEELRVGASAVLVAVRSSLM